MVNHTEAGNNSRKPGNTSGVAGNNSGVAGNSTKTVNNSGMAGNNSGVAGNNPGRTGNTRKHGNNSGVAGSSTKTVTHSGVDVIPPRNNGSLSTQKSNSHIKTNEPLNWGDFEVPTTRTLRTKEDIQKEMQRLENARTKEAYAAFIAEREREKREAHLQARASSKKKAEAASAAKAELKKTDPNAFKREKEQKNAIEKENLTKNLEKFKKALSEIMESISCHETSRFPSFCSVPSTVERTPILADLRALEDKLFIEITKIKSNPIEGREEELAILERQKDEVQTSTECHETSRFPKLCSTPDFLVKTSILDDLNKMKNVIEAAIIKLESPPKSAGGKRRKTRRNRTKRTHRTRRH